MKYFLIVSLLFFVGVFKTNAQKEINIYLNNRPDKSVTAFIKDVYKVSERKIKKGKLKFTLNDFNGHSYTIKDAKRIDYYINSKKRFLDFTNTNYPDEKALSNYLEKELSNHDKKFLLIPDSGYVLYECRYFFDNDCTYKDTRKDIKKLTKKMKKGGKRDKSLIVFADEFQKCNCCKENLQNEIDQGRSNSTLQIFIPEIISPEESESLFPTGYPSRYQMKWTDITICDNVRPCENYEIEIYSVDGNYNKEKLLFKNTVLFSEIDNSSKNVTLTLLDGKVILNLSEQFMIDSFTKNMPELNVEHSLFYIKNFCVRLRCSSENLTGYVDDLWTECVWFTFQCAH